jgi:hypothetical protein
VAKWFNYPTEDSLVAGAQVLGLADAIQVESDFSGLFKPVKVGHRICGNRLAIHPM